MLYVYWDSIRASHHYFVSLTLSVVSLHQSSRLWFPFKWSLSYFFCFISGLICTTVVYFSIMCIFSWVLLTSQNPFALLSSVLEISGANIRGFFHLLGFVVKLKDLNARYILDMQIDSHHENQGIIHLHSRYEFSCIRCNEISK